MLAVHDADIFPVFGDPKGILASGHSREERIRLLHDLRLAAGLIGGLRAVQDFFCVHVGQPFGECIGKLGFDLFFFLQGIGDGIIPRQTEDLIFHRSLILLELTQ